MREEICSTARLFPDFAGAPSGLRRYDANVGDTVYGRGIPSCLQMPRKAFGDISFSASSRWHASTSLSASSRLAFASSRVSPCEMAAGISSTKQVYPPSLAGSKIAVSFMAQGCHATPISASCPATIGFLFKADDVPAPRGFRGTSRGWIPRVWRHGQEICSTARLFPDFACAPSGLRCSIRATQSHNCLSSASPPETSTLPGASSMLSFFTTPSSTSME